MRPHYVQVKDDIYIRLDDTETILIVKGFKVPSLDKIISTFKGLGLSDRLLRKDTSIFEDTFGGLGRADQLSAEGRALFKEAFLKEFPTITPEEIEDAILIMEPIMDEIATIEFTREELIESGKDKITLITGPPRLHKTTAAFKMASIDKTNIIIYVARTIKTAQKTVETVINHLPTLKDYSITPIISSVHACKIAKEIDADAGYIAASMHCKTCPYQFHSPMSIATPLQLTPEDIIRICDKENACPKKYIKERIEYFKAIGKKQIIIMTYARLKYDITDYVPIGDNITIFDEARHIKDMAIITSMNLNDHPTKTPHKKIIENYVEDIKKIDFSMLSPEGKEIIEDYRNIWCQSILEGKEFTGEFKVRKVLKELYDLSLDGPAKKSSFKTYATQMHFVDLLDKANGNNVAFDDELTNSDKENTVALIIRNMEDENIESRYNFHLLMASGKHTYLVDSTPYPKDYYGSWLGAKYEIKEIILPLKYEFYIPIENTKRRLKDTYLDEVNRKRFTDIINGIKDNLNIDIFSASKKEQFNLKDDGIECKYMRGVEVEGVQSDKDYTLITRFPLQNPNSEKYREATIIEMNDGKGDHMEYIYINSYQEMIQAAFRTAQIDKTSGSFLMSMDESHIPTMKKYWPWLDDIIIKFIPLPKKLEVPDKIDYATKALLFGKVTFTASEELKIKKILDFFKAHPDGTVRACLDFVGGNRGKSHRLLIYLRSSGKLPTTI